MTTLELPPLPLIATLPALPAVLCDADDAEVAATREVYYEIHPGTPDAAGRALGVCDSAHCLAVTRRYVDDIGARYIETVRYDGRPQA